VFDSRFDFVRPVPTDEQAVPSFVEQLVSTCQLKNIYLKSCSGARRNAMGKVEDSSWKELFDAIRHYEVKMRINFQEVRVAWDRRVTFELDTGVEDCGLVKAKQISELQLVVQLLQYLKNAGSWTRGLQKYWAVASVAWDFASADIENTTEFFFKGLDSIPASKSGQDIIIW
jgi:hypothetical protein